jgi:hypothetical protein
LGYKTKFGNYVKFLRGTPAAWQSIEVKDNDTLYFIAEQGAERGQLYLGAKLIADGDSATHIRDLEGVLIHEGIPTDSLLVYNAKTDKWETKSAQQVLQTIVQPMVGASADENGEGGLVPVPLAGEQDLYLRGDGSWASPTEQVEQDIADLEDEIAANAQAWQRELANLRGGKTGTIVDIATDLVDTAVAQLVADAPDSFDTLREIAEWINQHDSAVNIADLIVKVDRHENALNGTEGAPGLITKVGDLYTEVFDPATGLAVQMSTVTGSLSQALANIKGLNSDIETINLDIDAIKELLMWQELVDEELL